MGKERRSVKKKRGKTWILYIGPIRKNLGVSTPPPQGQPKRERQDKKLSEQNETGSERIPEVPDGLALFPEERSKGGGGTNDTNRKTRNHPGAIPGHKKKAVPVCSQDSKKKGGRSEKKIGRNTFSIVHSRGTDPVGGRKGGTNPGAKQTFKPEGVSID